MREITRLMINEFKIMDLGYDFMGYKLVNESDVSFHHYLIARRDCKRLGLGEGYTYQNGVILNAKTSHPELHLVESKEEKLFYYITSEFLDMKNKGYLDIENLKRVQEILLEFEHKYRNATDSKGKELIKRKYIEGKVKLI